jgi:hypothetical protein
MAHQVSIPIAFEFRTSTVKWAVAEAAITGWCKRDDGTPDGERLCARLYGRPYPKSSISYSRDSLPYELHDPCIDAFYEDPEDDDRVAVLCSRFQPRLFVWSSNHYYRSVSVLKSESRPADAWQMREDFLRISGTEESVCEFLNKWGTWSSALYVELGDIIRLQKAVRDALMSPPARWFAEHFRFPRLPAHLAEYPFLALITDSCEDAIRMTVTIDLLRRLKFKTCARSDCKLPFAIESRHKRRFCSQYCAHLVSVRKNRQKRRKELSNSGKR